MNSLPSISHRLFAAAAGPAATAGAGDSASASWTIHTVPGTKIVSLEVVGGEELRPRRPVRRLRAWPGRSKI